MTALGIYGYYKYNKIFRSTDNAYVNAYVIKVGGYRKSLYSKQPICTQRR